MPIGGEIVLTQKAEGGAIAADLAVIQGTAADQVKLPAATGDRAKGITALAVHFYYDQKITAVEAAYLIENAVA